MPLNAAEKLNAMIGFQSGGSFAPTTTYQDDCCNYTIVPSDGISLQIGVYISPGAYHHFGVTTYYDGYCTQVYAVITWIIKTQTSETTHRHKSNCTTDTEGPKHLSLLFCSHTHEFAIERAFMKLSRNFDDLFNIQSLNSHLLVSVPPFPSLSLFPSLFASLLVTKANFGLFSIKICLCLTSSKLLG